MQGLRGLLAIGQAAPVFNPTRPGLVRVQTVRAFLPAAHAKAQPVRVIDERLVDRSRYPGHVLRSIRADGRHR